MHLSNRVPSHSERKYILMEAKVLLKFTRTKNIAESNLGLEVFCFLTFLRPCRVDPGLTNQIVLTHTSCFSLVGRNVNVNKRSQQLITADRFYLVGEQRTE